MIGDQLSTFDKPLGRQPSVHVPELDALWTRSERSIVASGSAIAPTAQQQLCAIQGFQTWEADDIYKLDVFAAFASTGVSFDMQVRIQQVPFFTIPLPSLPAAGPFTGTFYLAPNSNLIEIISVAGGPAGSHYLASLILTRMPGGFRVG